ncbi:NAD(P)H-dependent glycerol-3-phosphate dehydrogenase [Paludisphaera sp.]|uniref:NAD(P)H-dependent glycerol-3-phosphate dehydrogenase n=1 Tax=Paludisphaera sp. TaxID=2017432 RepID=UPI00301C6BC7
MRRVAVLGGGGMGTATAMVLARSGADARLWVREPDRARVMAETRRNERHLPGVEIPEAIRITGDPAEAMEGADVIVAAIPTSYLRATLAPLAPSAPAGVPALSVVKGIEFGTFARPTQIIAEALGPRETAVLTGPSHAEELARGMPASLVVAGPSVELCEAAQASFSHATFRLYRNADAVGAEVAGALKNILGIAAGVCDGLEIGDNAKAALLTRGLVEIARMGVRLGGRIETFYGLAGVGDVVTTCFSPFGRNREVGRRVGRGEALADILADMANVSEGVPTIRSVHALAEKLGVEMPITDELHRVLFEGKPPRVAVVDLMTRAPKDEAEL